MPSPCAGVAGSWKSAASRPAGGRPPPVRWEVRPNPPIPETDMENEDIPLSPRAGWEAGVIPADGVAIVRVRHAVGTMERGDSDFHVNPTYALTTEQARELGQKLLELAGRLETPSPPDPSIPRN